MTSVSSYTRAVAARNRSAGSSDGNLQRATRQCYLDVELRFMEGNAAEARSNPLLGIGPKLDALALGEHERLPDRDG